MLSFALFPQMGHVGLGVATSVAGWVNVALLYFGLKGLFTLDQALLSKIGRICASSAVMALCILPASFFCKGWIFEGIFIQRIIAIGLVIGTGITAYALSCICLKATNLAELKSYLKKS